MMTTELLAGIGDYFVWWQAIPLLLLIGVIIFYVTYKRRQM